MIRQEFLIILFKKLLKIESSIKLQKIFYFTQQFENLNYIYNMSKYGPFSEELAQDIEQLKNLNIIEVNLENGTHNYKYNKKISDEILKQNIDYIEEKKYLFKKIKSLNKMSVCDLEIMATIHFIFFNYLNKNNILELDKNWNEVLEIFKIYKGNKFSGDQIILSRKKLVDFLNSINN